MLRSNEDTTRRAVLTAMGGGVLGVAGVSSGTVSANQETQTTQEDDATTFTVQIENVSSPDTLQPSDGGSQSVPISPGVYVVFSTPNTVEVPPPLFSSGSQIRDNGLEELAEAGDPSPLAENAQKQSNVSASGTFDTPVESKQSGLADAGKAYRFRFEAVPGQEFTFGTMFVPSNDLFFSPLADGIPLFFGPAEDPKPLSANVTERIGLWDAGTEKNEEPGVGPNQAPRQSGPNAGEPEGENTPVRTVSDVNDGYNYPDVDEVLQVMVWPDEI